MTPVRTPREQAKLQEQLQTEVDQTAWNEDQERQRTQRKALVLTLFEFNYLKTMIIDWLDEGFASTPFDTEVYALIDTFGIVQTDVIGCDITPPALPEDPIVEEDH